MKKKKIKVASEGNQRPWSALIWRLAKYITHSMLKVFSTTSTNTCIRFPCEFSGTPCMCCTYETHSDWLSTSEGSLISAARRAVRIWMLPQHPSAYGHLYSYRKALWNTPLRLLYWLHGSSSVSVRVRASTFALLLVAFIVGYLMTRRRLPIFLNRFAKIWYCYAPCLFSIFTAWIFLSHEGKVEGRRRRKREKEKLPVSLLRGISVSHVLAVRKTSEKKLCGDEKVLYKISRCRHSC